MDRRCGAGAARRHRRPVVTRGSPVVPRTLPVVTIRAAWSAGWPARRRRFSRHRNEERPMNRRQLLMLTGGLPLMSTAYAQTAKSGLPPQPPRRSVLAVGGPVGRAQGKSGRPAGRGALAARCLPRRARRRGMRGGLPRPEEPLVHRRQRRADPDQRLGRCLDLDAQRLCRCRAQHGRRGGGRRLRAHAPPAARGEGRRPLLSGHVERARLAARLDAHDGPHRAARWRSSARAAAMRPQPAVSLGRRRGVATRLRRRRPRPAATCRAAAARRWAWRA